MRQSSSDKVTVVGAGVTLHEALTAYDRLKGEGINIRVIDPFTLKPIDKDLLIANAKATGGLVITVEDHYDQGESFLWYMRLTKNRITWWSLCNLRQ